MVEAARRLNEASPPPPALVFATIHRRAIDLARRDARRTGRENAAIEAAVEPWFDTSVEDRERAHLVQDAMSKLPDIYREVITLKLWGGLTFAEIAGAIGVPANTAASRYRYGLEELRKLMKVVLA
jgi:RNA polymerase sigma-70 factor (ECF subfamily)